MTHYAAAASTFEPPLIAHNNHFLGDISSSDKVDAEKPISCGIYRFEPGHELVYTYTYHEMKIILEGEGTLKDGTGKEVHVSSDFSFPPQMRPSYGVVLSPRSCKGGRVSENLCD